MSVYPDRIPNPTCRHTIRRRPRDGGRGKRYKTLRSSLPDFESRPPASRVSARGSTKTSTYMFIYVLTLFYLFHLF